MNRHISIVASLFVIFCTSWAIAQIPSGNPKRGEKIYQQFCLRCHGEKLDGRGPEAQDLKVMPADLRSASARTKSDWELLVIVSHGVMFTPMHGFRDVLTEQDIKDILSYIRTEAPFTPVAWQLQPPTPLPMAYISTEHKNIESHWEILHLFRQSFENRAG